MDWLLQMSVTDPQLGVGTQMILKFSLHFFAILQVKSIVEFRDCPLYTTRYT